MRETHLKYYQDIYKYRFVLSPEGNGIDTYRTWESIFCGAIPIVQKSNFSSYIREFPIIEVYDIAGINPEDIFSMEMNIDYDFKKLTNTYWIKNLLKSN